MARPCILTVEERRIAAASISLCLDGGVIRGEKALRIAMQTKDKLEAGLPPVPPPVEPPPPPPVKE